MVSTRRNDPVIFFSFLCLYEVNLVARVVRTVAMTTKEMLSFLLTCRMPATKALS